MNGDIVLPSQLESITGALTADGVGATSIQAPGLRTIGTISQSGGPFPDSLAIINSPFLTAASFPQLDSIGKDLLFANNSDLKNINGFPRLQQVGGNVDLTGDFNQVSLPALISVGGGVNIQTTSGSFTCPIPDDRNNGVIQGQGFVCAGNIAHPSPGVTGANYTANTFPIAATATPKTSNAFQMQDLGLQITGCR